MNERELQEAFGARFRGLLQRLGGSVSKIRKEPRGGPDLIVNATVRGQPKLFLVEFKSPGEPRYLRQAISQLLEVQKRYPAAYPIVVAPYITERSAKLLTENNVGYMDLAGNALLDYGSVFVSVSGETNPKPANKQLRSLFSPKSSRVARVLLSDPNRKWYVKDLAKEASVSLGLTSKLKQKLIDLEYMSEKKRQLVLEKPGELLDDWAKRYSYVDNKIIRMYSLADPAKVEEQIARYDKEENESYALTMFSGASRTAAFVRYNFAAFYFSGDISKMQEKLQLKKVPTGANTWLMLPYDQGVFYGSQRVGRMRIVSNVQLYLDLATFKGRGEEQALVIREKLLRF